MSDGQNFKEHLRLQTSPLNHPQSSHSQFEVNLSSFLREGMRPSRDFLPPYVQPITVSVSLLAHPRPMTGSLPLVPRMFVTGEGTRRHVAS